MCFVLWVSVKYFVGLLLLSMSELELLKRRILRLLKEDVEFRYAVAGLIGLEEVLRRLDRNERELVKLREDMNRGFERHDRILEKHWSEIQRLREELVKLREDMNRGFKRHDEILEKHWQEIQKLRRDMVEGFRRYDEILRRHWEEIQRLREDLNKLREDMNRGFQLLRRHIDALGARWGMISEEAFREGLRGILEELGLKVERWIHFDREGMVFGYPSQIEINVAIKDGRIILVELSSHVRASDVYIFKRKAEFYEKVAKRKPDRLLMITPFADPQALELARKLGIQIYTKV